MPRWMIENELARGRRPGYGAGRGTAVSRAEVDAWIAEVRAFGMKSIICLLGEDQLCLYAAIPTGLVSYYRDAGFAVAHVPARDHRSPPLTNVQLVAIWQAYEQLPKPVLVHCSAGVDRTGRAVEYIVERLRNVTGPITWRRTR